MISLEAVLFGCLNVRPSLLGDALVCFSEFRNRDAMRDACDIGTHASLLCAGNFDATLEERQGLQTGSPNEVAFVMRRINIEELRRVALMPAKNKYGQHLVSLAGV